MSILRWRTLVCDTRLVVGLIAVAFSGSARGQSARAISLGLPDGSPPVVSVVARDSDVFVQVNSEQVWLGAQSGCWAISGSTGVTRLSYAQLESAMQAAAQRTKSAPPDSAPPTGITIAQTADTETVAGLPTQRLRILNGSTLVVEMWVARSAVPAPIRVAGDRVRSLMPPTYWRDAGGVPGVGEIALMYGIPVRERLPNGTTLTMLPANDTLPPWIANLKAACR